MFIYEKRYGSINGRGCSNVRLQKIWMKKEDTTPPTVSIHGLMVSCMIYAKKGRDVATAEIPVAFLQT